MLQDIKDALDAAIEQGTTFHKFREDLEDTLQKKGWWGKKKVVNPDTGEVLATVVNPARLDLIFRQNLLASYASGKWAEYQELKDKRPYLMYAAVLDSRTRPEHKAWDGTILPVDDPWWDTHYPPNGWRCRCDTVSLSERQMQRRGLTKSPRPPEAFRQWKNPHSGEIHDIPAGIDPGWDYNPGKAAPPPNSKRYSKSVKAAAEKSKISGPVRGYKDVEKALQTRLGTFTPHGIKAVTFKQLDAFFMETDAAGTITVNTGRFPELGGFAPARDLKAAVKKIAAGKGLSFNEEYAVETFWHELLHAQQTATPDIGLDDLNRSEALTQWLSRRTYGQALRALGGEARHQRAIKRSGYGYRRWVANFDSLLAWAGVDEAEVQRDIEKLFRRVEDGKYLQELAVLLSKRSRKPENVLLTRLRLITRPD